MDDGHEPVPGLPAASIDEDLPGAGPGPPNTRSRSLRDADGPENRSPPGRVTETKAAEQGQVYLVGAGPGDPDLLTRRAWKVLSRADAVLYDSLTSEAVLSELPDRIETVDVGKRPPDPVAQPDIHERLRERATAGETVVRLKGGDPYVFGRGGEEAEYLSEVEIPFEVVPGVSSLLAAPSVSNIPLTHRDHASSLTVVTGRETPDKPGSAIDWSAIADSIRAGGTLVVLMGVATLPTYTDCLASEGVPDDTPVGIVQKATWEDQQTVESTLGQAEADARAADVEPPAVTIVGDVVAVRDRLDPDP